MIHFERQMRREEKNLFAAGMHRIAEGERERILAFARERNYFSEGDSFSFGISMSNSDYVIRISFENYTHPEKTNGKRETKFYSDPIRFDERTSQWRKLVYLPGVPESQVKVSILDGYLRVSSPVYVDEGPAPTNVREKELRRVSDGVFEVLLR